MTTDGRFDPPAARVADVESLPTWGAGAAIALGVLVVLQLAVTVTPLPFVLTLVDSGVLSPLGLMLLLAGELCLAAGAVRLARHGHQGGRLLLGALVLLVFSIVAWRAAWPMMAMQYTLGILVAAGGWLVSWQRRRVLARLAATGAAS